MLSDILLTLALAATQFTTLQPSQLVLDGSANIGRWRCRSQSLDANLQVEADLATINAAADRAAAAPAEAIQQLPLPRFRLTVPVSEIRCANRLMEREMSIALRGDTHPSIDFTLREIGGPFQFEEPGGRYSVTVAGDLTIAGSTRRIRFPISAWRLSPGSIYVRAAIPLAMTDFGVRPPTSLFGLIRSRSEIVVYFDLRLTVAAPAS